MDAEREFGPGEVIAPSALTPGRVVWRWTESTRAGVFAPAPCHDEQAVKLAPGVDRAVAICATCKRSYDVVLYPESDGGAVASFRLRHLPFLMSRRRPTPRTGGARNDDPGRSAGTHGQR